MRRAQARSVGHLLGQHGSPAVGQTVKHFAALNRQPLDQCLEVRCLFVDQTFQIFHRGAERRLDQHLTGKGQQSRIATSETPNGLQATALQVQVLTDLGPTLALGDRHEYPAGVLLTNTIELEDAEELVEGLAVAADGVEERIGGSQNQDFGAFHQRGAQLVDFPFVLHLSEDGIDVLHEENQPLTALLAEVHERCKRIRSQPLRVLFAAGQRVRSVRPPILQRRAGKVAQRTEPEIRQVHDPIALLVKRNGLPMIAESRVVSDRVQETEPECRFSHAARADEHHVLTWTAGKLLADQT